MLPKTDLVWEPYIVTMSAPTVNIPYSVYRFPREQLPLRFELPILRNTTVIIWNVPYITVLRAQVYAGDNPGSATLCYSPDTYGNNKTGTLGELCTALIAYSDSAKAYFIG